jgi:hypothetical protein
VRIGARGRDTAAGCGAGQARTPGARRRAAGWGEWRPRVRAGGVVRHGATIAVDLREGSIVAPGTACIEMAMRKTVRVSLGALEPGSYRVVAGGRTARLQV